jgi:protein CpxP
MRRILTALVLGVAATLPAPIEAQRPDRPRNPPREQMERQVREGLWRVAKQRVPLTDDQLRKLQAVSARHDTRRRALNLEERTQRQALRGELGAGDRANQERVGAALDRLLQIQRERLDIAAEEQRELAAFMTPVQRARYSAMQDQLRRRVQTMQRRRGAGAQAPGR